MGRGHLSEQELQSLALAGTLRQDVQVHTTAVYQLCAHACLAQSVLQPGDDPLGFVPLHSHVVAQLVRPLLALCLPPHRDVGQERTILGIYGYLSHAAGCDLSRYRYRGHLAKGMCSNYTRNDFLFTT